MRNSTKKYVAHTWNVLKTINHFLSLVLYICLIYIFEIVRRGRTPRIIFHFFTSYIILVVLGRFNEKDSNFFLFHFFFGIHHVISWIWWKSVCKLFKFWDFFIFLSTSYICICVHRAVWSFSYIFMCVSNYEISNFRRKMWKSIYNYFFRHLTFLSKDNASLG